jgi:hypothetical protein
MNQRLWAPVDIERILDHIKNKKSLEEISKREKRTIPNIQSKLKEIAADLYFNKNMEYDKVEEITGIEKSTLLVKRIKVERIKVETCGSPKIPEVQPIESVKLIEPVKEIEQIPSSPQLRLSTENPFSISSIRTLIQSTVEICLLPRN